ncbi:DUF1490 domain-containing protein [Berryella wangjianweii]|uniref:DUF1490 domain-containing protein n=1 Tax=Berryella wangjianweii TaxID=2734634 RepID=A0A6M8J3Q1_9ACTN|nr:DUF6110 family protein [Berryella wangjianweii]NPD32898.1 DUF1490 domain-containing protein [Eggerthellaceae bacterium zg-997]QKF07771.1 DUF1490 domain-containing protein [Berryella wangjianweii]
MKSWVQKSLLVGGGFLAGTVGVRLATSKQAKDAYVRTLAQGMKVRSSYESMVEQAKAEYDEIVAKATYINVEEAEKAAEADKEEK